MLNRWKGLADGQAQSAAIVRNTHRRILRSCARGWLVSWRCGWMPSSLASEDASAPWPGLVDLRDNEHSMDAMHGKRAESDV